MEELRCDTGSHNSQELFSDQRGEAKQIMNSESVSLDSEEEDLKFMKQQEEEMYERERREL